MIIYQVSSCIVPMFLYQLSRIVAQSIPEYAPPTHTKNLGT